MQKSLIADEYYLYWFNQVTIGIMMLCSILSAFLPDIGITLGTVGFLFGISDGVALNLNAAVEYHRPIKANLTAYCSWLVFLANATALRNDTTRVLQGICAIISFWQTFFIITWTLLLPQPEIIKRTSDLEVWIGATLIAITDVYLSTYDTNNDASILLAAYCVSRASMHPTKKVVFMGVAGTVSALALSWQSNWVIKATIGFTVAVAAMVAFRSLAQFKWIPSRYKNLLDGFKLA